MTLADLVLYRRMRGIFWGLLVVGVFGIPFLTSLAWTIPSQLGWYTDTFVQEVGTPSAIIESGMSFASLLGVIAAVILGATAGSVDLQRGVLRDLVLTGKPRWRIVVGRLAAALSWLVAFIAAGIAVSIAIALTIAPLDETLDWADLARIPAAFAPMLLVTLFLATGVALIVGSRGPAIAVYFGVAFLVDNILGNLPKVGEWWREVSLGIAQEEVLTWIESGKEFTSSLDRSSTAAVVVLIGWGLIPFALGLVRLTRRDL